MPLLGDVQWIPNLRKPDAFEVLEVHDRNSVAPLGMELHFLRRRTMDSLFEVS